MKLIRISLIFLSLINLLNADSIYKNNFESYELNKFPDDMMEIDGLFKVNKNDQGKKHLEMASEPLTENAVIFGPSIKNSATLEVKVRGFKKRRSFPRFGIGLHGISGFRLRVVPSKALEEPSRMSRTSSRPSRRSVSYRFGPKPVFQTFPIV